MSRDVSQGYKRLQTYSASAIYTNPENVVCGKWGYVPGTKAHPIAISPQLWWQKYASFKECAQRVRAAGHTLAKLTTDVEYTDEQARLFNPAAIDLTAGAMLAEARETETVHARPPRRLNLLGEVSGLGFQANTLERMLRQKTALLIADALRQRQLRGRAKGKSNVAGGVKLTPEDVALESKAFQLLRTEKGIDHGERMTVARIVAWLQAQRLELPNVAKRKSRGVLLNFLSALADTKGEDNWGDAARKQVEAMEKYAPARRPSARTRDTARRRQRSQSSDREEDFAESTSEADDGDATASSAHEEGDEAEEPSDRCGDSEAAVGHGRVEQERASRWQSGDFVWAPPENSTVLLEDGWPKFQDKELGIVKTVVSQSGRTIDVVLSRDDDTLRDIHGYVHCPIPLFVACSFAAEANAQLWTAANRPGLHLMEGTLVAFPRSYPVAHTDDKRPRKQKRKPSLATSPPRGLPMGTGAAAVNPANVLPLGAKRSRRSQA